ncbi:Peroxin-3 [Wilcoxina mikolae CBS 423.85]|nr:Peroxin-3 [Wilcoxina mikolae CBS 423.85]
MFEGTRNFFKRNRTNLAVGFGLAGAGYLAVQFIGNKLAEARTRMMSDRVAKENINRRFQQNQEDCTYTVLALLPTATENIVKEFPVESLTQELQQKKAARIAKSAAASTTDAGSDAGTPVAPITLPSVVKEDDAQSLQSFASETFSAVPGREEVPQMAVVEKTPRKTKLQLWDEIKISSLTRSFTLLYTLSLLTLLTRVQLNLLGRKNYLSSVLSLAERNDNDPTIRLESHDEERAGGLDIETNRQYLTFSWWLLHRGWRLLSARVETATKQVFGPLTPRDTVSLGRFRQLAMEVRRIVETPEDSTRTEIHWLPFLLPPSEEEPAVLAESGTFPPDSTPRSPSAELRRLLDETSDLLESPNASTVMAHMLAVGFELLIDGKLAPLAYVAKGKTVQTIAAGPGTGDDSDAGVLHRITEVVNDNATAKFASVLAGLARQAHVIGNGSPNEYLSTMEKGTELEGFSALVYSSNFEFAQEQI